MLGLSPEVTTALVGVAVLFVGQALLMWRREEGAKERAVAAEEVMALRHLALDKRLEHQDRCIDDLQKKVEEGNRRIWESIDATGRQLANLNGRWDGVVLEREFQARARETDGKA